MYCRPSSRKPVRSGKAHTMLDSVTDPRTSSSKPILQTESIDRRTEVFRRAILVASIAVRNEVLDLDLSLAKG